MKSAGCSRGNAPWSARRRGQEGIESAPVRRRQHGRGERTSTEVVGREFADANLGGELLDDMPDELFRYSFAPNSTCATHPPEKAACANSGGPCPVIQKTMHPIRDRNGPNVTTLSAQVHDCPMTFALLEMAHGQAGELVPTESARKQEAQQCPITLALHLLLVGCLPECLPLLGGQPVAKPDAQLLQALDPPDSSRQIGAEEPAVCRLVRKTAHRS